MTSCSGNPPPRQFLHMSITNIDIHHAPSHDLNIQKNLWIMKQFQIAIFCDNKTKWMMARTMGNILWAKRNIWSCYSGSPLGEELSSVLCNAGGETECGSMFCIHHRSFSQRHTHTGSPATDILTCITTDSFLLFLF